MPATQKKDLYICTSLHDINQKTQVDTDKNTKVKTYCKSADKMFREAEKAESNQDEERAYILYMKFTSLVQYIIKRKEYKADKAYFDSLGGIKNATIAINKAEILQKSLSKRYNDLKEEQELKAKLESEEKAEAEQGTSETPDDTAVNGIISKEPTAPQFGQDGGMTANQLYKLLNDESEHILVMDVRCSQDYKASHIQYSQVISVPQEAVVPGTTVTKIEVGMPSEAKTKWDSRGKVDCIVMLDWNSTAKDLVKGSTLASLKDAMYKWDSTALLKTEPVVLEGGYESWLLRYPMFTTNPHVTGPPQKKDNSSTSLSFLDFDYPSLEDDKPKPKPEPIPPVTNGSPAKQDHPVNNTEHPAIGKAIGSAATDVHVPSPAANTAKSIPAVNRSNKPRQILEIEVPKSISSQNSGLNPAKPAGSAGDARNNSSSGSSNGNSTAILKMSASQTSQQLSNKSDALPSAVSSELPKAPVAKPHIPDRALKPSTQDKINPPSIDKGNGNSDASSVSGNVVANGATINQEQGTEINKQDKPQGQETKTEDVAELTRMQKKHQLEEQIARQELERLRQDKMKTENKQLRLEKAEMEKELQEKAEALKHMQEELEAQKRQQEQKAAEQAAQSTKTATKTVLREDISTQAAPGSLNGEAKPPATSGAKPESKETKSQTSLEPQSSGKIDPQRSVSTEASSASKPVATPRTSTTSLPTSSSTSVPRVPSSPALLPPGWERKLHSASNKYYYIDHNTERTQWEPPSVGPGGAAVAPAVTSSGSTQRLETKPAVSSGATKQPSASVPTTKTRLKLDSSETPKSGLKRSFSSPNIAQMVFNEGDNIPAKPTVNRAVKPVQRLPSSMMQAPQPNKTLQVTRARNLNPVYGNPGRSLTGLRNLGNTCFMNSVVQCLSNSTLLSHYFITDKYVLDINSQNPLGRGGNVAQEFAVVIKALWSGQYRSISPLDLRDTVTKYVPEFRKNIGHHHDSQEFLLFLLDGLHEDLNQVKKREYIKEENLEKYPDDNAAKLSWKNHERLNQSIIVTLFQGQFKSTVRCLSCDQTSVKFEAFMYLSLPIPSTSRCTLQQCLQRFSTEEKLSGDNAIYCSHCKTNRDSAKVILIWKLPRILLIHLKRFYYEGMWRQKLQTMVDFPLYDLDMSHYTSGPKPSRPYQLYAVSNHIGTLDGGHYTACCRNVHNNRWYKFDDHEVYEASQSNIKSSAAYILFYSSLDQMVPY